MFGPRWALCVGAVSGFAAAIVGIYYLAKYCRRRVHIEAGRLRFSTDDAVTDSPESDYWGRWRGSATR